MMVTALEVEVGDTAHVGPLSGTVTAVSLHLDEDGTPMAQLMLAGRHVLVDADALILVDRNPKN